MGVSEKLSFFRFHDQEIAAVLVLPTALNVPATLFLKRDIVNVECEITVNGKQLTGTLSGMKY